jgi:hypothetical protein
MDDQGTNREGGAIRFRKLRIGWSICCGVAVVLMVVLWLRSYIWNDHLSIRTGAARHSNVVLLSNWGFLQALFNQTIDIPNGIEYRKQPAWERTDVGFEWRGDGAIKIPDLFPITIALMCGFAPWIHWSLRFSIRTILFCMAVLAMTLGAFVYFIKYFPTH